MWLLVIWVLVLVLALAVYYRQTYSFFSRRGVKSLRVTPPFDILSKNILLKEHFDETFSEMYSSFPGERFIGGFELVNPMLIVRDLELIKKITVKDFDHFRDHRHLIDEKTDPLFGRNLFSLQGQEWKDMRSTLGPAFSNSKIKLMMPFIVDVADQMVISIKNKITQSGCGEADLEVKDLMKRFASDVIASCSFGLKVNSYSDPDNYFFTQALDSSTLTFKQLLLFSLNAAFPTIIRWMRIPLFKESARKFFKSIVLDTMRDRESKNIIRHDLIHLLMEAKKEKPNNQKTQHADVGSETVEESSLGKTHIHRGWSENDVIAQSALFFVASFESALSGMTFSFYELALNPDVQEKLAKEIQDTDARTNGQIDLTTIQEMKYMDMVVKEVLRIWSPIFSLDRLCVKDYNLGKPNDKATKDYIIRKGEGLHIPIFAIHINPEFFPDPLKFDPERFSDENKHNINPSSYMPFGSGPRMCIGQRLGLCQMKIMLYKLLKDFEVSPGPKTCIPIQLEKSNFNFKVKGEFWLRFKPRA